MDLYPRAKKQLLDEMEDMRKHYAAAFPGSQFEKNFGESLDSYIYTVTTKALGNLKKQYLGDDTKEHRWIGINPPPDTITMLELYEQVQKFPWKWMNNALWTIEQNTDGGIRPHVHMFVEDKVRPARIIEQICTRMKLKPQSIDVKTYTKGKAYEEHIRYIQGDKKTEKVENVEKDIKEKNDLGIPLFIDNRN